MSLSEKDKIRYARHLILPEFGPSAQEELKRSKVLVVGIGGLGTPILQYLTAAGVGTIGLVDFDTIDQSNLQRQVLFSEVDLGRRKTEVAAEKLSTQNSEVTFEIHDLKLNSSNAMSVIQEYDVVVDGTDNFPTRYLINDACVLLNKPFIYGSIFQYEGQVSVFNYENGPNYRDLFPTPPPPSMVRSCAEGGVLGVLPGIIGSIQALEAIKVLCGIGDTLSGRLYLFDALNLSFRTVNVRKDPGNPVSGENPSIGYLIDYDEYCGVKTEQLQKVSVEKLYDLLNGSNKPTLIDVREKFEFEAAHLEALNLPLSELGDRVEEVPLEGPVIFYCKSGIRSASAILELNDHPNSQNFSNLDGGILAWKELYAPEILVL